MVRLLANGRNIVDQPLPTLLDVTCCVHLHTLLHVVVCCCAKFETGQTFQPTTPNTSFLLRDRRSVAQQCWIRLRSSSNIVGATHAHYAWFTKSYGLYPSQYALQVPTLLEAVASVCAPVPTRTQGWGFVCLCCPWGRAFDWSCSPGGGDIWIFLRPTWRYLTADLGEKDWDGTSVSHFHASRMRRTVWKDQEVMEANENKRRLSGFHCFVFKFRLF